MYPGYDVLGGLREALLFLIFSRTTWGPRFCPRLMSVLRGSQPEAQVEEGGSVQSQSRLPHPQASWSVSLCKPLQTRTPPGLRALGAQCGKWHPPLTNPAAETAGSARRLSEVCKATQPQGCRHRPVWDWHLLF